MDGPGMWGGDVEDSVDCRWFDNRDEGLVMVNASRLGEAMNNPVHLVSNQSPIGVELVFEQPLIGDDIGTCDINNGLT
jgi:hypothetical protein